MFQRIARFVLITLTITVAAACGGSSSASPAGEPAKPAGAPAGGGAVSDADVVNHCVAVFTRQHDCTDEYIPALVDTRIDLDLPPGIAAAGATPDGRADIIDQAKQEWAVDGVEPKRTQTCQAIVPQLPPEVKAEAENIANTCLAKSTCGEFVQCVMPFQRQRFEEAKARMGN